MSGARYADRPVRNGVDPEPMRMRYRAVTWLAFVEGIWAGQNDPNAYQRIRGLLLPA